MNKSMSGFRFSFLKWKNLYQLGFRQIFHYAKHKLKEKSGIYLLLTPIKPDYFQSRPYPINFPIQIPSKDTLLDIPGNQIDDVLEEANQILSGKLRFFGGDFLDFSFTQETTKKHWSFYKPPPGTDIKFIWEPARFGWVYPLCRAYILSENPDYGNGFMNLTRQFAVLHPPNCGPHWVSAQEVALRLIAILFASRVFEQILTPADRHFLSEVIISHAQRIPPTHDYALAQDNNHLLSEALGLYCAGVSLPTHPQAKRWRRLGWLWLMDGLVRQIDGSGEYCQYSLNYHRLMLQIALLAQTIGYTQGETFPPSVLLKLKSATEWLISHLDPVSGRVPNLGHNDGSYIFPLSIGDFQDCRPVCQAASIAFLKNRILPPGPWDEMAVWMNLDHNLPLLDIRHTQSKGVHKISTHQGWAVIRAVKYHHRPAHADQLHVDIWWNGLNIALDPGTYSYNLPPPWDNALAGTAVHNTIMVDSTDQMIRAGRFLWLDWKRAYVIEKTSTYIKALLEKYNNIPVQHQRTIKWETDNLFIVADTLTPIHKSFLRTISVRLQWMLPDWETDRQNNQITFISPKGNIQLKIDIPGLENADQLSIFTFRGEDRYLPDGTSEAVGWFSPTYGKKYAIRVIHAKTITRLPFQIISTWQFPE